jgi:hypothetical protein
MNDILGVAVRVEPPVARLIENMKKNKKIKMLIK